MTVVDLHAVLELPIRDQLCPEVDVDFNSAESLELILSFIGISKLHLQPIPQLNQSLGCCEMVVDLVVSELGDRV